MQQWAKITLEFNVFFILFFTCGSWFLVKHLFHSKARVLEHVFALSWFCWLPTVKITGVCFSPHSQKEDRLFPLHNFTLNYPDHWSLIRFPESSILSTTAWQRQQQKWCWFRDGSEGEEYMHTLGVSSQIVSAFHLVGSLSIQLFTCTSAGVCAGSCSVLLCVFVCVDCQRKEAGSLLCQGL